MSDHEMIDDQIALARQLIEDSGNSIRDLPSDEEWVDQLSEGVYYVIGGNKVIVFSDNRKDDIKGIIDSLDQVKDSVDRILFLSETDHETVHQKFIKYSKRREEGGSGAIVQFRNLIQQAYSRGASDVHIYRTESENMSLVTMRLDSKVVGVNKISAKESDQMLRAAFFQLKEQSSKHQAWDPKEEQSFNMQINVKDKSESGKQSPVNNVSLSLRYEHGPSYVQGGYDASMRLLVNESNSISIPSLEELGYDQDQIKLFLYALRQPSGMILINGTTNSGKSTTIRTLADILQKLKPGIRICSLEDPVEYVMPGVRQTAVRSADGHGSFAAGLKSLMRRDPDAIILTEIRDEETALIAAKAVESGHLVLSTTHSRSALAGVSRLYNLGVPLHILSQPGFLNLSVFQKLVPKLNDFKVLKPIHEIEDEKLKRDLIDSGVKQASDDGDVAFINPDNPRGGMTVASEFFIPDMETLACVAKTDFYGLDKVWKERASMRGGNGPLGRNALDHAIAKISRKEVDPYEVLNVFGSLTTNHVMADGIISNDEIDEL